MIWSCAQSYDCNFFSSALGCPALGAPRHQPPGRPLPDDPFSTATLYPAWSPQFRARPLEVASDGPTLTLDPMPRLVAKTMTQINVLACIPLKSRRSRGPERRSRQAQPSPHASQHPSSAQQEQRAQAAQAIAWLSLSSSSARHDYRAQTAGRTAKPLLSARSPCLERT